MVVLQGLAAGTVEATVIINILPSMLSSLMTNLGVQVIPSNTALLNLVHSHTTDRTATDLKVAPLLNQGTVDLSNTTQLRQEIGTVGRNSSRGITVRRLRECKTREGTNRADIMAEGRRHPGITNQTAGPLLLDATKRTTLPQDTAHSSPREVTPINIIKGDISIRRAILVIIHTISRGRHPRAVGADSRAVAEHLAVEAHPEEAVLGPRRQV